MKKYNIPPEVEHLIKPLYKLKEATQKNNLYDPDIYRKIDKNVIYDVSYLKHNFLNLNLSFSDFPDELKTNDFFILEYFSRKKTNKKEYKFIPDHLLKEPFFVNSCLLENPDIYLLADKVCHSDFALKELRVHHHDSFAKYATDKQLNDLDFCLEALKINAFNYQYFSENVRKNSEVCFQAIQDRLFSVSSASLKSFAKNLPKERSENEEFVKLLLAKNDKIFPFLPEYYLKQRNLCFTYVARNSSVFKSIDDSLKNDVTFFEALKKYKKERVSAYLSHTIEGLKIEDLLIELPNSFFTKEFSENNKEHIVKCFLNFPQEHRKNINIIRAVYLGNNDKSDGDFFKSPFLNKILHAEIKEALKNFINSPENKKNRYEDIQKNIISFIDSFILHSDLQKDLTNDNNKKIAKIKI